MKNKRPVHLICALLLAAAMTSCSGNTEIPELMEPAVVEADIAVAEVRELMDIYCYEGIVEPNVERLGFTSSGMISEVYVGIGSNVKAGDVLAELDTGLALQMTQTLSDDIEYAVKSNGLINKQTECDIEIAETELLRLRAQGAEPETIRLKEIEIENLKNKLTSSVELQELSLERSRKQLEEYRKIIENSKIIAPCDGTVLYCAAASGGWAAAYSTVMWVADDTTMNIACRYIKPYEMESAYELYAIVGGKRTDITYIPYDRADYMSLLASNMTPGSVFSIDSDIGAGNGMYAYVMLVKSYLAEALAIPANAVMQDAAEYYVYLVSPDGTQSRQTVKTGMKTEAFIQITEGLAEGDRVYVGN